MISCYLQGGLGNYLFQIAAAYSKSIDLNIDFVLSENEGLVVHKNPNHYLNNFFRNIKFVNNLNTPQFYNEPNFSYSPIPDFILPTKIIGYFQSEKYFLKNKNKILSLFECPEEIFKKLVSKYPQINEGNTCSLHVRRGDYLNLPDHHPTQSIEYYKKSVSLIGNDKTYFIFSDDIEWCKNNFDFIEKKVYCEFNEDYEDLYLMSLCENNIMANSSFSWWGSWLNQNINKKVVAPKNWFGPSKSNFNLNDLYFENIIIL